MSKLLETGTYRGHTVEVHVKENEQEQVISNLLDSPVDVGEDETVEDVKRYVIGYIDGWKDAGGA